MGPYKYINGEVVSYSNHHLCPEYACGDAREDARVELQTQKPQNFTVERDGVRSEIQAVTFGKGFQKFKDMGVIASYPEGVIYSLPPNPPKNDRVYYFTGQSALYR